MHSTYLVARRDYLGYVSAWGFWLGLLFTPLILGIFMLAPTLAQNSQPTRYFTVIESGTEFTDALRREMDKSAARTARVMLDPVAAAQEEDSEKLKAFDTARDKGETSLDAFVSAGGDPSILPKQDFCGAWLRAFKLSACLLVSKHHLTFRTLRFLAAQFLH